MTRDRTPCLTISSPTTFHCATLADARKGRKTNLLTIIRASSRGFKLKMDFRFDHLFRSIFEPLNSGRSSHPYSLPIFYKDSEIAQLVVDRRFTALISSIYSKMDDSRANNQQFFRAFNCLFAAYLNVHLNTIILIS